MGRCDIVGDAIFSVVGSHQEREIDNLVPMGKALGTRLGGRSVVPLGCAKKFNYIFWFSFC